MDPITIATIVLAVIQKIIEVEQAKKGTAPSVADVLTQLAALTASITSDEATNQAAAIAEEKARGAVLP